MENSAKLIYLLFTYRLVLKSGKIFRMLTLIMYLRYYGNEVLFKNICLATGTKLGVQIAIAVRRSAAIDDAEISNLRLK